MINKIHSLQETCLRKSVIKVETPKSKLGSEHLADIFTTLPSATSFNLNIPRLCPNFKFLLNERKWKR